MPAAIAWLRRSVMRMLAKLQCLECNYGKGAPPGLFGKGVRQPREPADAHAHRETLAFVK
jgi:hypothetical protein